MSRMRRRLLYFVVNSARFAFSRRQAIGVSSAQARGPTEYRRSAEHAGMDVRWRIERSGACSTPL
jgi:hypothetical protein